MFMYDYGFWKLYCFQYYYCINFGALFKHLNFFPHLGIIISRRLNFILYFIYLISNIP